MKKFLFFALMAGIALVWACKPNHNASAGKIAELEDNIRKSDKADTSNINKLLAAYGEYAREFPQDTMTPAYLYRAGSLAVSFNKGPEAIAMFNHIIQDYPGYPRLAECYFMKAFTYENVLKDIGQANQAYNLFLEKFPNHDLSDDAAAAIKYLGKSPDEMVREFEQKSADSAAMAGK